MAGPIVASLGPFGFHAYGFSLTGIDRSLKTPWAAIKVPGGLDRLQWLGGDSETTKIEGVLFPHEFGGQGSLSGIRAAAERGAALHLIQRAGGSFGNILSLFVIEGVDDKQNYIAPNGQAMRNSYTLNLRRYAGGEFRFQTVLNGLF